MGRTVFILAGLAAAAGALTAAAAQDSALDWWDADESRELSEHRVYPNAAGMIGLYNADGPVSATDHPFFTALGSNGRACVTCHQPAEAMSVSAETIARRWEETKGADPIFAAIDGANCPNLPMAERDSHSLLIDHGLVRVGLQWPPLRADGTPIEPEFEIEVVRDPTGCNLDEDWGLYSDNPTVSVYRRPRVAANLKYVDRPGGAFNAKNLAMPNDVDPETGVASSMNMMSDARAVSLRAQARDAAKNHLQLGRPLTEAELSGIVGFESQVYIAQSHDTWGGELGGEGGAPALGPMAMANGTPGVLGNNFGRPVFLDFDMWKDEDGAPVGEGAQAELRASIARGFDIFFTRSFFISDVQHINTVGLGNPLKRTCSTCHNMQMTGMDLVSGWVDVGSTNLPWAIENPDLPMFKVTCSADAPPHAYLGREIYTQDPGRALISGRCFDVGSIVMGQFRGLSSRAPYFSNGSLENLRELVDFYDRRFNIRYSEQEKQDLVNFLSVL